MNTSINSFHEKKKKKEHKHDKYSIVYKGCYSIEMYTSYGLESRGIIFKGKHTHTHTHTHTQTHTAHVFL
jgi:hypothetical protein